MSKDHTDAATITPEAKPNNDFCSRADISSFIKNTKAEPSIVPNSGMRSPTIIVAVISVIFFFFTMQRYNFVVSQAIPKSDASLLFVQFYRQSVGVTEEYKQFAGIFVRADWFVRDALAVEFADSCREVVHLESKVAQTCCFGV